MRAGLWLALALAAGSPARAAQMGGASGFRLVAPRLPAGSRVMGFSLHVAGGRVAAAPDCPAGWRFTIDNDPSWRTTVQAHAVVGAAATSPDALARMVRFAPAPPEVAADLGAAKMSVSGEVTVMRNGVLKTLPLRDLALSPKP